jgi:RNA polymerase sigma-70 factor (ECF subfamily)
MDDRSFTMRQAVERYLLENRDNLYRLAFSYVRHQEDALDILQESIYKALRHAPEVENPGALRAWVYRVVVRTALDYIKKRDRIAYVPEEVIALNPAKEASAEDFDLMRALRRLPDKHRTVVVLRFFEDMKLEDIATVLDENVNTVKTRLYKALRLLRSDLGDKEG